MATTGAEIEGIGAHEKDTAPEDHKSPDNVANSTESLRGPNGEEYPSDDELETLRHVHGKVSWLIYSIGVVELVERFAYYGTTAVCTSARRLPVQSYTQLTCELPPSQL